MKYRKPKRVIKAGGLLSRRRRERTEELQTIGKSGTVRRSLDTLERRSYTKRKDVPLSPRKNVMLRKQRSVKR